jgi:ubiquinone/menaquinone biosynthesis C-methylase UbiE
MGAATIHCVVRALACDSPAAMTPRTAEDIRDVNARYHDLAASEYDAKWSIKFDPEGQSQVVDKLHRALGRAPGTYRRGLEVGAGTGYFTLNLAAAGIVREAVATDISQGMLDQLAASAEHLELPVQCVRGDAAALPFPDRSFDLVIGHAALHHFPDPPAVFRELRRLLRPGGVLVFCGEPSRYGDRLARLPKRAALTAAPAWRRMLGASKRAVGAGHEDNGSARGGAEHELEWLVDVHSFTPAELVSLARDSGLVDVRVRGEELAAGWFGWVSRTLEGSAEPTEVPMAWRWYAYGGYVALRAFDRMLLEPYLPAALFYNLLLSARAPEE